MVLIAGKDIVVKINSVDYTQYITTYSESGGKKIVNKTKTFGNNYVTTVTGREDYNVTLDFKYDLGLDMDTLFESDTPVAIEVTMSTKEITYSNAIPVNLTFDIKNDNIVYAKLEYEIAAANAATYNKVLA